MINGKKVAGLLIEPVWQDNKLKAFIVGVGINVNTPMENLLAAAPMATSMHHEMPGTYTVETVTQQVSQQLAQAQSSLHPPHESALKTIS